MATEHYTNLINQLKSIARGNSEGAHERGKTQAIQYVHNSKLSDDHKQAVIGAICKAANPSGWYTESNGTVAGISVIEALMAEPAKQPTESTPFNRRNLKSLVADGRIFSVEFIKRSTGEIRTMTARLGVKRHLKGGYKAYNPAQHNLLTVFDMDRRGYRSIPLEAIQRLTVGGQTFNFAGV